MKIFKSAVLFFLVFLMTASVSFCAYAENGGSKPFLLGDIDSDGEVSVSDALSALKISAFIKEPTSSALIAGDIDADGEITPVDARRILRAASKLDEFENGSLPAVIYKMTAEPFCADDSSGGQIVKDRLTVCKNSVSVKTDEKPASELTGGERIERRTVAVNGMGSDDGEYIADCVRGRYISYPDSVYGSSFGDYALYFGLLNDGYAFRISEDNSVFSLSYDQFGVRYYFTFDAGRLCNITSEYNGESVSLFTPEIRFNECSAIELLSSYSDITTDYLNDYAASAAAEAVEIEYAPGDSDIYVTHDVTLPETLENYPSAKITWTSDCAGITSDGKVTRDKSRVVKAELTANVTVGSAVKRRIFTLEIMPENEKSAQENDINTLMSLNGGADVLARDGNGRVTQIDGVCSEITVESFSDALAVLKQNSAVLGCAGGDTVFEPASYEKNDIGTQYTFKQFFGGAEVYLRRVTVAADKNGKCIYIASGLCESDVLGKCGEFCIEESKALDIALGFHVGSIHATDIKKIIYALGEYADNPVPVWLVSVSGADSFGDYISDELYINAVGGGVIKSSLTHDSAESLNASGEDEHGRIRTFPSVCDSFYTYVMRDEDRNISVYDMSDAPVLTPILSFDNTFDDSAAVSAYINTAAAYDWFTDKFSRVSFDNKGSEIKIAVHDTSFYDNAYWDSETHILTFCENSRYTLSPVTAASAPDIACHEYAHAVAESITGELPYENAPGAVSEAYADIFACLIDGNWTVGEEWETVRDIASPYKFENPAELYGKYFVDCNDGDDEDLGGVHVNSTVVSHCAYLMTAYGLDSDTAAKLWYLSLSLGYDGTSDYSTVRRNVTKAAELMELSGGETDIINRAFDRVNIY